MTTLEAIRAELEANTAVLALVGTRIYPQAMPQGVTLPAVVITVVSEVPENSLTGTASTRLVQARAQVDCYAAKYLDAHQVAAAVDEVLANLMRSDLSAERMDSRDLYDDEAGLHRVSADYSIWR